MNAPESTLESRTLLKGALMSAVMALFLGAGGAQAGLVVVGDGTNDWNAVTDDTFPFTQSVSENGVGSFDLTVNATPGSLYVNRFQNYLLVSKDVQASASTTDYRHVNEDENLTFLVSNLAAANPSDDLGVVLTAMSGYKTLGDTLEFYVNGSPAGVTLTGVTDELATYTLSSPILLREGDTLKIDTISGDWRLGSLTFNIGAVNMVTTSVTNPGRCFLEGTFSDPQNRPDGVFARVVDNDGDPVGFSGVVGPDTAAADLDLFLVKPTDTIEVAYGLTGSPTEDPAQWSLNIVNMQGTFSTDWEPPAADIGDGLAFDQTDAFTKGFPMSMVWRQDTDFGAQSQEILDAFATQSSSWCAKWLGEQGNDQPEDAQWVGENLPNFLLVEHWLHPAIRRKHSPVKEWIEPAHLAYFEGSCLAASISASDTILNVTDGSKFKAPNGAGQEYDGNDWVVIVERDQNGKCLWDQSEWALVQSRSGDQLTVERGLYNTSGRSFSTGAYVAAHSKPYAQSGQQTMRWNLSTMAPTDSQGGTAGDFVVNAVHYLMSGTNATLDQAHGFVWDVPRTLYQVDPGETRSVDGDMDGIAENGYFRNQNTYALGFYEQQRKLRDALGEDRLFFGDGYFGDAEEYRMQIPGLWNGIEHDCNWDHTLKEMSSTLNTFRYYDEFSTRQPWNWFVRKDENVDGTTHYKRDIILLKNAFSTILNSAAAAMIQFENVEPGLVFSTYDEMRKGDENTLQWLGHPVGDIVRPGMDAPDMLNGDGVSMEQTFIDAWESSNATITKDGAKMVLTDANNGDDIYGNEDQFMTITLPNVQLSGGGVIVEFEAKSLQPLTFYTEGVGRTCFITARGANGWDNDEALLTSIGPSYFTSSAYFRNVGTGTVDIRLKFQGRQPIYIRKFTIRNADDVLAREFDNGVVLCNSDTSSYTFDMAKHFPGLALERLTANAFEPHMTGINNGTKAKGLVTVPGLEGLFLSKRPGFVTPVEDSYINSNNPATNYGSQDQLRAEDGSTIKRGLLKFNVQNVGAGETVTQALLKIRIHDPAEPMINPAVYACPNSWGEKTVTWNNAPAIGGLIDSKTGTYSETSITFDVTSYVTGNGTYSFYLWTGSSAAGFCASREHGTQNVPTLEISAVPSVALSKGPAPAELGLVDGEFIITRSGQTGSDLEVDFLTEGSAIPGTDYTPLSGSVIIPSGSASASVFVSPLSDAVAEGDESVIMTLQSSSNYNLDAVDFQKTQFIQDLPIDQWRIDQFGANATNLAVAGNFADPDQDGIVNLLEFGFIRQPLVPESSPLLMPAMESGFLSISFSKRKNAGVNYSIEWSTDLVAWFTAGIIEELVSEDASTESVKVKVPADTPRKFLRIGVED